jgi:transposase
MATAIYSPRDYDIFIGLDVDKKSFSYTVRDHYKMKRSKKIPADPEQFYNYIQNNFSDKRVICAYEAGPTGFHLHDHLKEKELPCLVTPPISIPKAPNERVKNNRIDSNKITEELLAGKLKSIRVPEGSYRELRHLVKIRENYASNRRAARQRIKALLLSANLYPLLKDPDIKWSSGYIKELKQIECSPAVRSRLDMLLMDLEYARQQTLSTNRTLKTFCKNNPEVKKYIGYLESIVGVGFITAVSILGSIGNPQNLKNPREIGAFVGLVPREHSTGDRINKGSITHLGNQTLRSLLIEVSWVVIRKDNELQQFYYRIKKRHHPKIASRVAIVAVARKLTQRIYKVLKEQRKYIKR